MEAMEICISILRGMSKKLVMYWLARPNYRVKSGSERGEAKPNEYVIAGGGSNSSGDSTSEGCG